MASYGAMTEDAKRKRVARVMSAHSHIEIQQHEHEEWIEDEDPEEEDGGKADNVAAGTGSTEEGNPEAPASVGDEGEDDESGTAQVHCSGMLQVERKGEMIPRFFVLYDMEMLYYETADSWHSQEPARGGVAIEEILQFEENEKSFSLHLESTRGKKPLQLVAASRQELQAWVAALADRVAWRLGDNFKRRPPPGGAGGAASPDKAGGIATMSPRAFAGGRGTASAKAKASASAASSRRGMWGRTSTAPAAALRLRTGASTRSQGAGRSPSLPRPQAREAPPGCLCAGYFNVELGGLVELRYFILYKEQLEFYAAGSEELQPEGVVPTADIKSLQVEGDGLVINLPAGQEIALKLTGGPHQTHLQDWTRNIQEILRVQPVQRSSALARQPSERGPLQARTTRSALGGARMDTPALLQEGYMLVTTTAAGGRPSEERRFLQVYTNRIDSYASQAEARGAAQGAPHKPSTILAADLRGIWSSETGFRIELPTRNLEFQVPSPDSVEIWSQSLQTFGGMCRPSLQSTRTRSMAMDRAPTAQSDVCTTCQAALTVEAVFCSQCGTRRPLILRDEPSWDPPQEFFQELNHPMVREWLMAHPSPPIYHGFLRMFSFGSLVARLCLLYPDRLEAFDRPLDAVHGRKPQFSRRTADMRSFQVTGHGFIIHTGTKALPFNARGASDTQAWSAAFSTVLREDGFEPPLTARAFFAQPTAATVGAFAAAPPSMGMGPTRTAATVSAFAATPSPMGSTRTAASASSFATPASMGAMKSYATVSNFAASPAALGPQKTTATLVGGAAMPATLSAAAGAVRRPASAPGLAASGPRADARRHVWEVVPERHRSPSPKRKLSVFEQRALNGPLPRDSNRGARTGVWINTSRCPPENKLLHGEYAVLLGPSNTLTGTPIAALPVENVNPRDPMTPRVDERQRAHWGSATKVTGERDVHLKMSPRGDATWSKPNHINHYQPDSPAFTPRRREGLDVTVKVTSADMTIWNRRCCSPPP